MQITVSDWQESSGWDRYSKGVKFRNISYEGVTCVQRLELDGVKHYEFFNDQTKYLIKDFSSPQMQAVEKILYFIQHEDKFKDVEKEQEKESESK